GDTLCFIEVKTRDRNDGSAERATQEGEKLNRIKNAAKYYCLNNNVAMETTPIQFEQVSIYNDSDISDPIIRHFVIPID
ncbi:MAG: YraN family protein, partial [Patescibacteria group bacterium]